MRFGQGRGVSIKLGERERREKGKSGNEREQLGAWVFNPDHSFRDLQNDLTVNLNTDLKMLKHFI